MMHNWSFDTAGEMMTAASGVLETRDRLELLISGTGIPVPDVADEYTAARHVDAFAEVDEQLVAFETASTAVLDAQAGLDDVLRGTDLTPPDLTDDYAAATDVEALDALTERLVALRTSAQSLLAAQAAVERPRSPDEVMGLIDVDLVTPLDAALEAFTGEDLDAVSSNADEVERHVDDAAEIGARRRQLVAVSVPADTGRAVTTAAFIGGVALLILTLGWWLVRRRRRGSSGGVALADVDAGGDATVDGDVAAGVDDGVELDEDALPRTVLGGVDGRLDASGRDLGQ